MKKSAFESEKEEVSSILKIIMKRDFSKKGYSGLAVKNSIFSFLTSFTGKIGGLLFTIIIARILMPELFGLYSLVISTVFIFISLADLGIGSAIIKFTSKSHSKKEKSKSKGYFLYLLKLKIIVISILVFSLGILSKVLAENYYQKPIFLGLLAGIFYLIAFGFTDFMQSLFQSVNKFKYIWHKEIIIQILRLAIVPLTTVYILKNAISQEWNLFWIILALSIAYLLALLFLLFISKNKFPFMKSEVKTPSEKKKKMIKMFILPLSATILTDAFFGNIDILMLGRFVSAEYIGFYKAAFTLVLSIAPLLAFSNALYPIFTKLKGKRLEEGFKKSLRIVVPLSTALFFGILLFAPLIIQIIFGNEYSPAISLLRLFSVIMLSLPATQIYSSYFIARGKSFELMKFILTSTVLNIVLNLIAIFWLLQYGEYTAVFGVAMATIISRYFLLGLFIIKRKKVK